MRMSHTPAPWEWDEQDGSIETPTGGAIAYVAHHGNVNTVARTGEDYSHADARLIAAAPRMLQQLRKDALVLESYAELLDGSAPGIAGELAALAAGVRAAISEATGEPLP